MSDEFNSSQPIYHQIMQRICGQILRSEFRLGDKLPSVRDLALDMGVNPNTIKRVYNELERIGIVETKRGQGTFVTESSSRIDRLRREQMAEHISRFVQDMMDMGFDPSTIVQGVKESLHRWEK
ncbi:GntR family transcriptional regulator [Alicyclobacillus dauci]|uniref:GntR family transcriptional regulator n=1 Tax=Alicyclobacillus dauci TaxID=1475485 RepID=A0ABY6Z5E2_9BACL|nr:GntR family transcriptional regulator [Alicyclobacillus dauci]WAH37743.1 GntR family transcriptional regulator [Alicyclobacillus dauci]